MDRNRKFACRWHRGVAESVSVAKLVYATVYAAVDWRLADARSLLVATIPDQQRACFEINSRTGTNEGSTVSSLICYRRWQSHLVSSDA